MSNELYPQGDNETYVYGIPLTDLPTYRKAAPVGSKPAVYSEGLNVDLLEEIFNFISEHPLTWRQASWYAILDKETGVWKHDLRVEDVQELNSCGTSFCFAGHVALREGFPNPPLQNNEEWGRMVLHGVDDEEFELVDEFAAKRLGLDSDQAGALFDGDNDLDDLRFMIDVLKFLPSVNGNDLEEMKYERRDRIEENEPHGVEDLLKAYNYKI